MSGDTVKVDEVIKWLTEGKFDGGDAAAYNKAVADCAEFVRNSPGRFGPHGRRDQLAKDMRKALTIETN